MSRFSFGVRFAVAVASVLLGGLAMSATPVTSAQLIPTAPPPANQNAPLNPQPQNPAPQNPAPQNPPPQNPTPENGKGTPNGAPSAGGAPVDGNTYKVGPADVLLIRVWNEPAFSGPVAVQENGKFTLQLVGDIDASGKTPVEIQGELTKALTKYVNKPLVTVTVQEVGSRRYYMDGLVGRPGEYALVVPTTILEAISKAGGLQDFANAKKIYVLRGDQRIPFNYKDVIHGKKMAQNIKLQAGDHIVIP